MTDFKAGVKAPDFQLSDVKLSELRRKGTVLLTFYKKTCPTCQLSYPFFQKIHQRFGGPHFQVIGIGQDPETAEFSKKHGITFRMVSDTPSYAVSKQYHLTHVPTTFLITETGDIDYVTVGFSKRDFLELTHRIGKKIGKLAFDLFENETVPDTKPG